jgi:hypothetical protein
MRDHLTMFWGQVRFLVKIDREEFATACDQAHLIVDEPAQFGSWRPITLDGILKGSESHFQRLLVNAEEQFLLILDIVVESCFGDVKFIGNILECRPMEPFLLYELGRSGNNLLRSLLVLLAALSFRDSRASFQLTRSYLQSRSPEKQTPDRLEIT